MCRWFHEYDPKLEKVEMKAKDELPWPIVHNGSTEDSTDQLLIDPKSKTVDSRAVKLNCGDTMCEFKIKTYLYGEEGSKAAEFAAPAPTTSTATASASPPALCPCIAVCIESPHGEDEPLIA